MKAASGRCKRRFGATPFAGSQGRDTVEPMNRLSPHTRKVTLAWTMALALVVFPALSLLEAVHSGRGISVQTWRARRIAQVAGKMAGSGKLAEAGSSTEVFNHLLQISNLQEGMFFVLGRNSNKRRANGDGVLQPEENCLALVAGLPAGAPDNLPVLLWDPASDAPSGLLGPATSGQWLSVDGKGRVTLRDEPPAWWCERTAEDLFPALPGVQRLLRP